MSTLLFLDSFSHYDAAQSLDKYDYGTPFSSMVSPGALGAGSYAVSGGSPALAKVFAAGSQDSLTMGFRFRCPNANFSANVPIIEFYDVSGNFMAGLGVTLDGGLVYRITNNSEESGDPNIVASSANGLLTVGQWVYLELSVVFSKTGAGTVVMRVNGTTVCTQSGINTNDPGLGGFPSTGPCTAFGIGTNNAHSGANFFHIQDLYVLSGTPGFLGDSQVGYTDVAGAGATTEFTPYPSGPNWDNVSEIPPDGDTTYNYSATTGQSDAYTTQPFPDTSGDIAGFQLIAFARKDSAGSRSLKLGVGNGSAVDLNAAVLSLNETYKFFALPYDDNPLTSAPLTPSDFATLQLVAEVD